MLTLAFFCIFTFLFVPLYFHFHVPTVGGALCRSHRNISWIQSEGAIGNQNVDFHALMPPNKMKTFRYRKLERYLICSVFLSISGADYGFGFLEIRFSALPYFFCGEVVLLKLSGQTEIMQKSTDSTMSRKWQHWQGQRATNILRHAKRDWNATHELLIQQQRKGSQIRPSWVNRKQRTTKDDKQKTVRRNRKRLALH